LERECRGQREEMSRGGPGEERQESKLLASHSAPWTTQGVREHRGKQAMRKEQGKF